MLAVLLLVSTAQAEEPIIKKAIAVEAEQLKALQGKSFEIASSGILMDGKKRHEVATWRKIHFPPSLEWVRGSFDGQPVDEEQLREKMAGKKKRWAPIS